MFDFYLITSGRDKDYVQAVSFYLESVGYKVWNEKNLKAGQDFLHSIEYAVENVRAIVIFISPYTTNSKYFNFEIGYIISSIRNKNIKTVIANLSPSANDIPPILKRTQVLDAYKVHPRELAYQLQKILSSN